MDLRSCLIFTPLFNTSICPGYPRRKRKEEKKVTGESLTLGSHPTRYRGKILMLILLYPLNVRKAKRKGEW
jgi:hypothetical protein